MRNAAALSVCPNALGLSPHGRARPGRVRCDLDTFCGRRHRLQGVYLLGIVAGVCIAVALMRYAARRRRAVRPAVEAPKVAVVSGTIQVVRPNARSVEGLEIQYGAQGLVRSVRVGAMNSEHKELLLTMDSVVWSSLPNAQKQEVLAAARSTWAAKMCPDGPDIAYVIVKTDGGEIVGRADPHSVTIA